MDLIVFQLETFTLDGSTGVQHSSWANSFSEYSQAVRRSEQFAEFTIHYRSDITPARHRILWEGAIWAITNADHDPRRSELLIQATFQEMLEVTHLQSTQREFIQGMPIVHP